MLVKMVEHGVIGKRKKLVGETEEFAELPNLLGEKNTLETSHPSSDAMKAFFEASLTTVGVSEVPSPT